jgi:hypothetical protein
MFSSRLATEIGGEKMTKEESRLLYLTALSTIYANMIERPSISRLEDPERIHCLMESKKEAKHFVRLAKKLEKK